MTKGTFQFLWNLQLRFNLIFSEEIIQYSWTSALQVQMPWNQADAPLLLKSFPKRPRTWSEASWFNASHKYKQNKTNKLPCFIDRLVWPVPLAQVWTHYKIEELNMWTLFCNVCICFLNSQIWKEIMLELNGKPSSVLAFSTDFSFQNLGFWNLFEFSAAEIS
jgi:hypothetical protein